MTADIYTATIYEEDLHNPEIEYTIEVLARLIPEYRPLYSEGEPEEDASWDIVEVYCNDEKIDTADLAAKLFDMTEDKLISRLIQALNEHGEEYKN